VADLCAEGLPLQELLSVQVFTQFDACCALHLPG
jgi:hypothetical protein